MEVQNMTDFEVTMKKTSTKLQMLKIARNECHQFVQKNIASQLETYFKIFEKRLEELNNLKNKVQKFMLSNMLHYRT